MVGNNLECQYSCIGSPDEYYPMQEDMKHLVYSHQFVSIYVYDSGCESEHVDEEDNSIDGQFGSDDEFEL